MTAQPDGLGRLSSGGARTAYIGTADAVVLQQTAYVTVERLIVLNHNENTSRLLQTALCVCCATRTQAEIMARSLFNISILSDAQSGIRKLVK